MHIKFGKMHNESSSRKTLSRVLEEFVLNNECAVEEIAKKIGKNYSTVLRAVRKLEKRGIVKLKRFQRTSKKGKEKRYYTITFHGLVTYLALNQEALKNIRKIAEAHSDMLLTFKKWKKFVEAECEVVLKANLIGALQISSFTYFSFFPYISSGYMFPERDEKEREMFDAILLGFPHFALPIQKLKEEEKETFESLKKIWKVVEKDYELRLFRERYLHELEIEAKERMRNVEEWKHFLQGLT